MFHATPPVRALVTVAALATVTGLTGGCALDRDEPRPDSSATASPGAGGLATLDRLGAELVTVIRTAAEALPAVERTYDTEPHTLSCRSAAEDPWPQQRSYNASVFLQADGRPFVRQVVERLGASGWAVRDAGRLTGTDTQHYTAGRDGFVLTIGATAARDGALVLGGSTPCVRRDGTVDRRR